MGSPKGSTGELLMATILLGAWNPIGAGVLKARAVAVTVGAKTSSSRSTTLRFNSLSPPFWFFGQKLTINVLKYKKLYVFIF